MTEWILSSTRKTRRPSSSTVLRSSLTNPRVPAMVATGTTRPQRAGRRNQRRPRPCAMATRVAPAQSRWVQFRRAKLTTASHVLCGRKAPRPATEILERRRKAHTNRHKKCSGSSQTRPNKMQCRKIIWNLNRYRGILLARKFSGSCRWLWVTGSHWRKCLELLVTAAVATVGLWGSGLWIKGGPPGKEECRRLPRRVAAGSRTWPTQRPVCVPASRPYFCTNTCPVCRTALGMRCCAGHGGPETCASSPHTAWVVVMADANLQRSHLGLLYRDISSVYPRSVLPDISWYLPLKPADALLPNNSSTEKPFLFRSKSSVVFVWYNQLLPLSVVLMWLLASRCSG